MKTKAFENAVPYSTPFVPQRYLLRLSILVSVKNFFHVFHLKVMNKLFQVMNSYYTITRVLFYTITILIDILITITWS